MISPGNKIGTMADAVALVPDGTRLAIGGFANYQRPMAFVRELVRRKRQNLAVVGMVSGIEADMLVGAGALDRLETSYVGLEKYGLARNFRRACEAGALTMVDYPEVLSFDRFRASRENLSFWACDYLGGTDILTHNPDIKPFDCPLTGRRLYAVPPADPQVAVLHAIAADAAGNVLMPSHRLLPQELDLHIANSCDTLIVTVERIVPESFIRRHSALNQIPSYRTTLIVEAPCGAHPTPTLSRWLIDAEHMERYVAASASPEAFAAYLDEWVFGTTDHAAYLDRLGTARLTALQEFDAL
ncbi:CoA transferase subunit A [Azospirillum canadense]|uniref:CoA transferase subunit A n=1 Tax=Azospirillum canadense TaxID=403962 RepID=UPI002226D2E1|nr:CoA-transferase [Azospirillum canadense]MCW2242362.1 glutaconate CoA-transferase subunit A [Azospirillum canadense]